MLLRAWFRVGLGVGVGKGRGWKEVKLPVGSKVES